MKIEANRALKEELEDLTQQDLKRQVRNLQSSLESLTFKYKEQDNYIESQEREIQSYKIALGQKETEAANLMKFILQKATETNQAYLESGPTLKCDFEKRLKDLQLIALEKINESYSALSSEKKRIEMELMDAKKEKETLKYKHKWEFSSVESSNIKLKQDITHFKQQLQHLPQENATLKQRVADLEKMHEKGSSESKMWEALLKMQEKCVKTNKDIQRKKDELKDCREKLRQTESKLNETELKFQQSEAKLRQAENNLEMKNKEIRNFLRCMTPNTEETS